MWKNGKYEKFALTKGEKKLLVRIFGNIYAVKILWQPVLS